MFLPEIWAEIFIMLDNKDIYYTMIILFLKSKNDSIEIDLKKFAHIYFLNIVKHNIVLKKYMEIYYNLNMIQNKVKYIEQYTNYYNYSSCELITKNIYNGITIKANKYINIILEKNNDNKIKKKFYNLIRYHKQNDEIKFYHNKKDKFLKMILNY